MIKINVKGNGKRTEIGFEAHIEGRENALNEFYGVIKALNNADKLVFCDALGKFLCDELEDNNDDKSEG